jgi:deferrochelatase/peroxidase EfeB
MTPLGSIELPRPDLDNKLHQPGITDPVWPVVPPDGIDESEYQFFAGRIAPQGFLTLVFADITASTRKGLRGILQALSELAREQMQRRPDTLGVPPQIVARLPDTYRVTVTVGFGASLFVDANGDDRFGIRHMQPRTLKVMPSFPGADANGFRPTEHATDVVVQICSDHPYVNTHIAKLLHKYRFGHGLNIQRIEHGFTRQDNRESLQFDDGISNLRRWPDDTMDRLAYVGPADNDLQWCVGGSYLVYRKMAENLPQWESISDDEQSQMIGREKATGRPLSRTMTCPSYNPACEDFDKMPVYPDPADGTDGRIDGHMRKNQPRRSQTDLFGIDDLDRMFLRRAYPFLTGSVTIEGRQSGCISLPT